MMDVTEIGVFMAVKSCIKLVPSVYCVGIRFLVVLHTTCSVDTEAYSHYSDCDCEKHELAGRRLYSIELVMYVIAALSQGRCFDETASWRLVHV